MAEYDNTGTPAPREDLHVAIAALLFECRLTNESARVGLESLSARHPAEPLNSELAVVTRFVQQTAEAFDALALKLVEALPLRGLQA